MLWVTGVILCPSPSNPSLSFGSSLIRSEHWAPFRIDVYTNLMWFNLMCFCCHPKTTTIWRWNSYTRNTSIQKKIVTETHNWILLVFSATGFFPNRSTYWLACQAGGFPDKKKTSRSLSPKIFSDANGWTLGSQFHVELCQLLRNPLEGFGGLPRWLWL